MADEVQAQANESTAPAAAAVKSRETAPETSRKPAAAPRVSMMGTGTIRSATPAAIQSVATVSADLECGIGQYPKADKCVACNQKK